MEFEVGDYVKYSTTGEWEYGTITYVGIDYYIIDHTFVVGDDQVDFATAKDA